MTSSNDRKDMDLSSNSQDADDKMLRKAINATLDKEEGEAILGQSPNAMGRIWTLFFKTFNDEFAEFESYLDELNLALPGSGSSKELFKRLSDLGRGTSSKETPQEELEKWVTGVNIKTLLFDFCTKSENKATWRNVWTSWKDLPGFPSADGAGNLPPPPPPSSQHFWVEWARLDVRQAEADEMKVVNYLHSIEHNKDLRRLDLKEIDRVVPKAYQDYVRSFVQGEEQPR